MKDWQVGGPFLGSPAFAAKMVLVIDPGESMPVVSVFFGMIIKIYYGDHGIPHMHVEYGSLKFVVAIESGRVLKGNMAPRLKKLIETWRRAHKDELLKAWSDAQSHKTPKRIKPLE